LNEHAKALRREMMQLEKRQTAGNRTQISAPEHLNDDLVCTLAIAAHHVVSLVPKFETAKPRILDFEHDHVAMTLAAEKKRKQVIDDLYN
jgi:hypothetical protein